MAKQPDLSPFIQASAQRWNVDPALSSSVVQQESSGNPGAVNTEGGGQGAYGAMQVRQAALADYNKANGTKYSMQDLLKPQIGVDVGTWYLSQQLDQFNDPVKALIAYKQGPNSQDVAKGVHPYANQVMARLQGPPAKPATLPGVPAAPQPSATDDDAILAAFSKGGAAPGNAVARPDSDDAILSAFTKAPSEASAAKPAPASQQAATAPTEEAPGKPESFGAGLGHGFGSIVLGAEQLAGKGLQQFDATRGAGNWLVNDANAGLRK
uniref:transglycosylase SLT domain-containing protein n=1 Tax=Cupriavidus basilensis TaxID=68895 RepID=UPI000B1997A5